MNAKVIKTDESVIYKGKIYKFGEELEIDDAIGKSLIGRGYIEKIADGVEPPPENNASEESSEEIAEGIEVKDVGGMSYPELKSYASQLGLPTDGKKEELVERINDYFGKCEEAETDDLPDTDMPD